MTTLLPPEHATIVERARLALASAVADARPLPPLLVLWRVADDAPRGLMLPLDAPPAVSIQMVVDAGARGRWALLVADSHIDRRPWELDVEDVMHGESLGARFRRGDPNVTEALLVACTDGIGHHITTLPYRRWHGVAHFDDHPIVHDATIVDGMSGALVDVLARLVS